MRKPAAIIMSGIFARVVAATASGLIVVKVLFPAMVVEKSRAKKWIPGSARPLVVFPSHRRVVEPFLPSC